MKELIEKLSSIPIDGSSDEDIFEEVQRIKKEALESGNSYIRELIG